MRGHASCDAPLEANLGRLTFPQPVPWQWDIPPFINDFRTQTSIYGGFSSKEHKLHLQGLFKYPTPVFFSMLQNPQVKLQYPLPLHEKMMLQRPKWSKPGVF